MMQKKISLSQFTAAVFLVIFTSCQKSLQTETLVARTINATSATFNLNSVANYSGTLNVSDQNPTLGTAVHSDFLGFSFETSALTNQDYFSISNTQLINLLNNIGGGVIRVGGNSADLTHFANTTRGLDKSSTYLYKDDITNFVSFVSNFYGVGKARYNVIFGLQLKDFDPVREPIEANYTYTSFLNSSRGDQLLTFEIGNEPDAYGSAYQYTDYVDAYKTATSDILSYVTNNVPSKMFAGPVVTRARAADPDHHIISSNQWERKFAQDNTISKNMITSHYYRFAHADDPDMTTFLQHDSGFEGFAAYMTGPDANSIYSSPSVEYNYRIGECNSIDGGGKSGMSNTFASALWGTDFLFSAAQNRVRGINFHTGNAYYTPIATDVSNNSTARPLYYAMLLFNIADPSQFYTNSLQFTNSANPNIQAFYFKKNGVNNKHGILILNKESTDVNITIKNNSIIQSLTQYELLGTLNSQDDTKINNVSVASNGNFTVPAGTPISGNGTTNISVTVKGYSASLYLIN